MAGTKNLRSRLAPPADQAVENRFFALFEILSDASSDEEMGSDAERADSHISYDDGIAYWNSIPATVDGVLGGFGNTTLPRADMRGSSGFIEKIARKLPDFGAIVATGTACDIGAGIGRVTRDVLAKHFATVDLVEPVQSFADQIEPELAAASKLHVLGTIYRVGAQSFTPDAGKYAVIWCQWCLGHLTDEQLVAFLRRCITGLAPAGLIFVKENNTSGFEDEFDSVDSSVTRSNKSFQRAFAAAGLTVVHIELQPGLPTGLYPVRMYALRPAASS
ncbi:alpha-N-methyltransferase NTM1 [Dipodascopsis tothii]|uniref:alpha-N-methyltransferase NTM1 n=1 Tax=Dipodascopsis tothii TaxID=44089 RepID=UPI0034CD3B63